MQNKTRVAIYCRVASQNDEMIEHQIMMLRIFARGQGYSNITIYSDNGYNGLNFDRPAFTQMENDIQAGLIGAIVIKDLSRIGRNFIEVTDWLERTRTMEVVVKSLYDEKMSIPFNDIRYALYKTYDDCLALQK